MKKKILFLIWSFTAGGGAEKILANISNNMDLEKYDIEILEYENFGVKEERVNPKIRILKPILKNYTLIKNPINRNLIKYYNKIINKMVLYFPRIIRKIYIKNKYDIEIAFNYQIPSILVSEGNADKKICWVHTSVEDLNVNSTNNNNVKKMYKSQRKAFYKIDDIVSISKKTKESIMNIFPETKNKIREIYNGYDFNDILSKSRSNNNHLYDKKIKLIAVGRLVEQKNFELLIEIGEELAKKTEDFEILILGDGVLKNKLQALIEDKGLENNIILKGFVDNPYPYIKKADLFCMTSIAEGFPTVLVESMALKTPFISTRVAGADELSLNGQCGIISEEIPRVYADKLFDLVTNVKKTNCMGENAYVKSQEYSIEQQIKKIDEIISI